MSGEPPITSLTNPRVKAAVRLRDRREREETGLTIVDGAREILRALDAGVHVQTAFIAPDLLRTEDALSVDARLHDWPAAIEVSPAVLAKVAYGDRSDGIVAIVEAPARTLDDLVLPDDPLILVIEGVEKPGNLGAVLRTADAAGAHAVIAADPRTDLFNPNAIRASIGTRRSCRGACPTGRACRPSRRRRASWPTSRRCGSTSSAYRSRTTT